MKSSRRSRLRAIVITAVPLTVVVFALIVWRLVTDAAPPDTRDLTFRTRPVSDAENGLALLLFAKDDLYWPRDKRFKAVLRGEAWHGDVVEEVLQKNAPLLDKLERSLETTDFVYKKEYRDFLSDSESPGPPKSNVLFWNLPRIVALRAQAAHREGAHERALADAFTLVEFAQKIKRSQMPYILDGYLVEGWGYKQLVTTLSESDPDAALVRTSIDRLKRSEPQLRAFQESLRNAYEAAALGVDHVTWEEYKNTHVWFEHRAVTKASVLFFMPESTKAELAKIIRQTIHHLDTEALNVPFPTIDTSDAPFFVAHNPRSQDFLDSRYQERFQRALLTERVNYGLTTLFLALKAHHLDHGRLPERLEELVPTYVNELPVDPFDGKPLRYDPVRLRIYSTGIHAPVKQEGVDTVALPEWFNRKALVLGLKVTGAPKAQLKVHDPVFVWNSRFY